MKGNKKNCTLPISNIYFVILFRVERIEMKNEIGKKRNENWIEDKINVVFGGRRGSKKRREKYYGIGA